MGPGEETSFKFRNYLDISQIGSWDENNKGLGYQGIIRIIVKQTRFCYCAELDTKVLLGQELSYTGRTGQWAWIGRIKMLKSVSIFVPVLKNP